MYAAGCKDVIPLLGRGNQHGFLPSEPVTNQINQQNSLRSLVWQETESHSPAHHHSLRVFGSQAYVHIPSEKRTKLEAKAEKMTLVGCSNHHKAYRFINPSNDKVVYNRNARFLESEKTHHPQDRQVDVIEIESPLSHDIKPQPDKNHKQKGFSDTSLEYESGEEFLSDT
ncbi:uncharacterized protein LOC129719579 [Wyeomyia smithii]|uniref:uncharacterized protein LOC129719579 n=1 Tax=Wyeomyia smithii TaxID=174621 RepID=UPI002467BE7B|nr:uncharacterized protein LOC129719579 [Wyeomyia smithii]